MTETQVMNMTRDQLLPGIREMDRIGGGFAQALARAMTLADSQNLARLQKAFPDLLLRYLELARKRESED